MSKPIKIVWPVADVAAVCALQTTAAGGGPLKINGTLATTDTSVPIYAVFPSIIRAVTLTSAANLSGTQFTITGYVPNSVHLVTSVIAGPNANTVTTAEQFNIVTSVSTGAGLVGNVSVGTGRVGSTFWLLHDYFREVANAAIVVSVTANTINYTFQSTLDDPFISTPVSFAPIEGVTVETVPADTPMINATVSILSRLEFPVHSSRILINSSDATGTLTFSFLQQGLNS